MKGRTIVSLAVGCCLSAAAAGADEVDELIRTLRPSPLDNAAWAASLLKAAEGLAAKPKVQARLYEKAYECGLKTPKGYPAAIRAARAMIAGAPADKLAWQQKLLAALKLDWRRAGRKRKKDAGRAYVDEMIALADTLAEAGKVAEALDLYTDASRMAKYYAPGRKDEVARKLQEMRERQKLQQELARHERLLAANPDNVAVREALIRLYLVEFDRPADAAKLLTPDLSEQLRTYVPLAAGKVDEIAKGACLELGDWYRRLAATGTSRGKQQALARAWTYYERLVRVGTDPVRTAAGKTRLAQVAREILEAGLLPPNLRRGLVLYYGFDADERDRATDKGGKGNHGEVTEAKWTKTGKVGGAYLFDGQKAHVRSSRPVADGPFSFAVWVFNESECSRKWGILQSGSNWRLVGEDGGGEPWLDGYGIEFVVLTPNRNGTGMAYSGTRKWLHLAGTYDGGTLRLYANGSLTHTAAVGNRKFSDNRLLVGRKVEGHSFQGTLDEAMIWARALSPAEVGQIYMRRAAK